jgi:hypothetical protein
LGVAESKARGERRYTVGVRREAKDERYGRLRADMQELPCEWPNEKAKSEARRATDVKYERRVARGGARANEERQETQGSKLLARGERNEDERNNFKIKGRGGEQF